MVEVDAPDMAVDITRDTCPMTFVRTRLALDRMAPGQVLKVTLRGEEPRRNVPLTAIAQGHEVLAQSSDPDGVVTLLLRKGRKAGLGALPPDPAKASPLETLA